VPTITGIKTAKRRSGWMEIWLDGASSLLLPQDKVLSLGLATGDQVSTTDLERIESAARRAEAMRIALRYLSVRPRSRRELAIQLRRKGLDDVTIQPTLERCDELGFLDDRAFAAAFARDRIRLRPCGVRRMKDDLRSKGVSEADAIAGIAQGMKDEGVREHELLERVAERRAAGLRSLEPEVATRRLFAFLSRRGFPPGDIRRWIETEWETG